MVAGWQKRLWAPALLLTIVGGWWLAIELSQHCSALKDAPAGCFEFWFNRYQTLISSTAAIVAAWIAVRPVWRQLNLASAQTAVARYTALYLHELSYLRVAQQKRMRD
jgi:hypothetical protein